MHVLYEHIHTYPHLRLEKNIGDAAAYNYMDDFGPFTSFLLPSLFLNQLLLPTLSVL